MWMWMLLAFLLVALVGVLLALLAAVAGVVILAIVALRTDRVGDVLVGVARKPPRPVDPPGQVESWYPYWGPPYSSWPTLRLTHFWWEQWP